ncbi:MAG TPA: hypothetical protein VKM54_26400 [Myxococcota bacterium]|nr:hypothetical protein [Myxococcota bacterium]
MRIGFALLVVLTGCAVPRTSDVSVPTVDSGPVSYPAGELCVFPQPELEERLRAQYAAWAIIYKLSPEERECLAGRQSFDQQIRSYRRACESAEPGSADAVVEDALRRCYAEPTP